MVSEKPLKWQDAVALLAKERTLAVAYAQALKKYGDEAAVHHGSLQYNEAKAEYDGMIAGLSIALVRKRKPDSLSDLRERLRRGFEKREVFCREVREFVPHAPGEKGVLESLISTALAPLIEAIQALYAKTSSENELTRRTILTQLEATKWPDFSSIESGE